MANATDPSTSLDRAYEDEQQLRQLILLALYDVRRSRPSKPDVPLVVLSELAGCPVDELQFTLWYLRGKKLIDTSGGDDFAITVAGVDYVEARKPVSDEREVSDTHFLLRAPTYRPSLPEPTG